jgi:hypothetical protein
LSQSLHAPSNLLRNLCHGFGIVEARVSFIHVRLVSLVGVRILSVHAGHGALGGGLQRPGVGLVLGGLKPLHGDGRPSDQSDGAQVAINGLKIGGLGQEDFRAGADGDGEVRRQAFKHLAAPAGSMSSFWGMTERYPRSGRRGEIREKILQCVGFGGFFLPSYGR